jgi:hypothetical protein
MPQEPLATHQKAFAVNMDLGKYGAFAEIGAGQEVARWFFRAGGPPAPWPRVFRHTT